MAHGRALRYVGDGSRHIVGIPRQALLPADEAALPRDLSGEPWTFAKLVATGDWDWERAEDVEAVLAEAAAPEPEPPKKRG